MYLFKRKNKREKNLDPSSEVARKFRLFYRLLIFSLMAVGVLFSWMSINKENNDITKQMIIHSKILKNTMKNEVAQIEYQLLYASSKISSIYYSPRRIEKLLSSLSSVSNNNISLSWNAYSWIDKNDEISIDGTLGILRKKRPDVSNRDYLRFTKFRSDKVFLGRPIYGALSKRFIIPVAVGTFSNNNKYLGTLVFGLDIDKIKDKLESETNNKDISFLVFKEGNLLFYSGDVKKSTIDEVSAKVKILSLEEGDVETKLTNQNMFFGGDYISVFKKDANFPIEVAVIYNRASYKNQIISIILEKMAVVLLLIILFFILFKILYLRIIQPVSHLSELAKQISKRNFSIKIQKPTNKELNEIYDSLELIGHLFEKEESMKRQLIDINKKLVAENISKNDFFQAICQDIRSPIFSISNDIKSLEELTENEKIKEIINNFNENITDMLQLTEDLLDISRTSTGSININTKSKINLFKILNRSTKICSNFAKKKNVIIKNISKQDVKDINLDPKRLRQILVNIITKLIVTSKKEGLIEINIEEFVSDNQEKLRISIKSNSDHTSLDKENDDYLDDMQKFGLGSISGGVASLNADLKNSKDLVSLMEGIFEMEIKKKEWCVIKLTFKY